jgi:hypothetical protein
MFLLDSASSINVAAQLGRGENSVGLIAKQGAQGLLDAARPTTHGAFLRS